MSSPSRFRRTQDEESGYFDSRRRIAGTADLARQIRWRARRRENADRMIFTEQTFSEYPNYWLADKPSTPKQVTDADHCC
jgi:hypothetical protein